MSSIPDNVDSKRVQELVACLHGWAPLIDGHGAEVFTVTHLRVIGRLHRGNSAILLVEIRNLLTALDEFESGMDSGPMRTPATGLDDRL